MLYSELSKSNNFIFIAKAIFQSCLKAKYEVNSDKLAIS